MQAMKDSGIEWIGQIPQEWKVVLLSSIFNEHKQKNTDLLCSNLLSLSYGKIIKKNISTADGLLPVSFEGYNIVNKNDIVLRLTDLQNDQRSLRTGLVTEKIGIITSAYVTLRLYASNIASAKYMHYFLYAFDISKGFYGMGDGVRQSLNYDGCKKIQLLFPPLPEQQRIADYLDKQCFIMDKLAENLQQQIEKLREYKQSVITEAVTKGLDPNVAMKDSGVEWIGQIPKEWKVIPIKSLFSFGKGLTITKADLQENGVKVINYGQIHAKYNRGVSINNNLYRFVSEKFLSTNHNSLIEFGDFIFADTSEDIDGAGNFVYIDKHDKIFAGYHTLILQSLYNNDNKFLAYLFLSTQWRQQIQKRICGIKVFTISKNILSCLTIIRPPLPEQQRIVDYLDKKCEEIDKLIKIKQEKIDKLSEYKKSLIYECVTGKREVAHE